MTQTLIWFDVDGVLADFCIAYLEILNHLTGRRACSWDVTDWDFTKCVASVEEDAHVWRTIAQTPMLVAGLPEYAGAVEVANKLRDDGYVPRVLTAPAYQVSHWCAERVQWLNSRNFSSKEIVLTANKTVIHGDVLVEDSRANLVAWCNQHEEGVGFLVDQPWNQGTLPSNAVRISSYERLTAELRKVL